MRKIISACICLFAILITPQSVFAGAGACYNISDADARAYCIARERHDASYCYNIQSASMRSTCMGEVKR